MLKHFTQLTKTTQTIIIAGVLITIYTLCVSVYVIYTVTEQSKQHAVAFSKCDFGAQYLFSHNGKIIIDKKIRFCNPIKDKEIIPDHIKISFDKSENRKDLLPVFENSDQAIFYVDHHTLWSTKFHITANID